MPDLLETHARDYERQVVEMCCLQYGDRRKEGKDMRDIQYIIAISRDGTTALMIGFCVLFLLIMTFRR